MNEPSSSTQLNCVLNKWTEITVGSRRLFIKYYFTNGNYIFFLTSLIRMWETSVNYDLLKHMLLVNNPLIDSSNSSFVEYCVELIFDGVKKENESTLEFNDDESVAILKLIVKSDVFLFKLPLSLTLSNFKSFSREIVYPLLFKMEKLRNSENDLINLLIKKDREISEYKMEGATLSLKQLETETFSKEKHCEKYGTDKNLFHDKIICLSDLSEALGISEMNDKVKVKGEVVKDKLPANVSPPSEDHNIVIKQEVNSEPKTEETSTKSEVKSGNPIPKRKPKMNNNRRKLSF